MAKIITFFTILALSTLTACSSTAALTHNQPNAETVVVIHGLGRSGIAMWRLVGRVEDAGYEVWYF